MENKSNHSDEMEEEVGAVGGSPGMFHIFFFVYNVYLKPFSLRIRRVKHENR